MDREQLEDIIWMNSGVSLAEASRVVEAIERAGFRFERESQPLSEMDYTIDMVGQPVEIRDSVTPRRGVLCRVDGEKATYFDNDPYSTTEGFFRTAATSDVFLVDEERYYFRVER